MTLQRAIEEMDVERWATLTKRVAQQAVAGAQRLGEQAPKELMAAASMSVTELIDRRKRGQPLVDDDDPPPKDDGAAAAPSTTIRWPAYTAPPGARTTEAHGPASQIAAVWPRHDDTLTAGHTLKKGQAIRSHNGAYTLKLQDDGNLVLYARDQAVWETCTAGQNVVRAEMQTDGNFVLYTPEKPVWHTDTKGKKNVRLVLQDDRNLVLYAADGPAWSSKTDTTEPPPLGQEEYVLDVVVTDAEKRLRRTDRVPTPPRPRTYTVVSGDTLWAIAERFYGDGNRYHDIADASGITDPDSIQPGQRLMIP